MDWQGLLFRDISAYMVIYIIVIFPQFIISWILGKSIGFWKVFRLSTIERLLRDSDYWSWATIERLPGSHYDHKTFKIAAIIATILYKLAGKKWLEWPAGVNIRVKGQTSDRSYRDGRAGCAAILPPGAKGAPPGILKGKTGEPFRRISATQCARRLKCVYF